MRGAFSTLMGTLPRYAWAAPCSLLGLLLALLPLLCGARLRVVRGVIEISAPTRAGRGWTWVRRLPFAAITFGHVVLAAGPRAMARWRSHERVHVRQYERWGVLFVPAYLLAGAWQWRRGRSAYWHNPFEVQARREAAVSASGGSSRTSTTGDSSPGAGSSRNSA
jgi:hypothetical protein